MPYNVVADTFTQRNFVADFLQAKCDFTQKRLFCVFERCPKPLHSMQRGKMHIGLNITGDMHYN